MVWWMFALAGLKAAAQMRQAQMALKAQQEAARAQILANVEMQKHLQQRANEAIEQGQYKASIQRLKANQYIGRQEAEIGASVTGGPSADRVLAGSELGRDMDTIQIQRAARNESENLRFQSDQLGRESENIMAQVDAARDGYNYTLGGIAINAASELAMSYVMSNGFASLKTKPVDTTTSSLKGGLKSAVPGTTPYVGSGGEVGMVGKS